MLGWSTLKNPARFGWFARAALGSRRALAATRVLAATALLASGVGWVRAEPAADKPASDAPADVAALVNTIQAVGPKGQGHRQAAAAWKELARRDAADLPAVLAGFDGANKLAVNWLRSAVETIAQRALAQGGKLPQAELEKFLADTRRSPAARRLTFELLTRVDSTAAERLIPGFLNDPSLELRRDAVARALARAEALVKADKKAEAAGAYRQTLSAARDLDQINAAAEQLRKLGEKVDLPSHFGFITRWRLLGPFDNTNTRGFDTAYGPEVELAGGQEIDLQAAHVGKNGEVKWVEHATDNDYGELDLNKTLAKHKGALVYALAEFHVEKSQPAELRLGCINANKIWLNGELLAENHVYHANTFLDQYVGKGQLRAGKNIILLKICQNEQTEDWAQRWQFQLRVCDQYGTAILSSK